MASTERREYAGGAKPTSITTDITSGSLALSIGDPTGWPTGAVGEFFAVLARGQAGEEKVKCSARSGNAVTVVERGADGTAATAHVAGTTIEHGGVADDFDLFNQHTSGTQSDPHPEYNLESLVDAKGDLIVASADNTPTRLAVGADYRLLSPLASASNGVQWRALATAASVATQESTAATSFTDLSTAGPEVTVTTGTTALVIVSTQLWNTTAGQGVWMGFSVSGATTSAAADGRAVRTTSSASSESETQSLIIPVALTPGSNTFTAKYRIAAGSGFFSDRHLIVIPL